MIEDILDILLCPYCGNRLTLISYDKSEREEGYGILSCTCAEYPIVADIPVINKGCVGTDNQTVDQVVGYIREKNYGKALCAMMIPIPNSPVLAPVWAQLLPDIQVNKYIKSLLHQRKLKSWKKRSSLFIQSLDDTKTVEKMLDFYFRQSMKGMETAYEYFYYRFGQPRHLATLSMSTLVKNPDKPILDIGCGFGHSTFALSKKLNGQVIVATDKVFFALYVAKNWVASNAIYIYCDAESALPFQSKSFSAIFCADGVHSFTSKFTLLNEILRIIKNKGFFAFITSRNALHKHLYRGRPLSPSAYHSLLGDIPHRIIKESVAWRRYVRGLGPELAVQPPLDELENEPILTIVGSRNSRIFKDYKLSHERGEIQGKLIINPLYKLIDEEKNGIITLKRSFPSEYYAKENQECTSYLPEYVSANKSILESVDNGKITGEVEHLMKSFVILDVPVKY